MVRMVDVHCFFIVWPRFKASGFVSRANGCGEPRLGRMVATFVGLPFLFFSFLFLLVGIFD